MVVAVQRELAGLAENLRQKGYDTVFLGEYKKPIDAFIYEGSSFSVSNLLGQPWNLSMGAASDTSEQHNVLLIDASGKTIDEIINVLKRKLYSPLF